MPNQKNPDKAKLQIWVDKSLIKQVDGVAAKKDVSRAAVVTEAIKRYLDDSEAPATKADLVAFAATLTKAIEAQPVQVLPAPVPTEETNSNNQERKGRFRRLIDAWHD